MRLNDTLLQLDAMMRGRHGGLSRRVIYRGTHASIHGCDSRDYSDPLWWTWTYIQARMRSRFNAPFNWRTIEEREGLTKQHLAPFGVTYMDTFVSSSYRANGGRMPGGNCNHFCLPGPIDEWTRLLLAYLT